MPWAVAGLAAASIAGSVIGANAQGSAANQEQQSFLDALRFQEGNYNTAQQNLNPYIKTGDSAIYSLGSLFGLPGAPGQPNTGQGAAQGYLNFTQTPAYQFPLQQGELAANRSLAASGLTGSGAAAKALTQYGQGYASQGFNSYISQLAGLAGLGEQGAAALGNVGVGVGTQVGTSAAGYGAAGAAGTIGQANSLTGGIGGLAGLLNSPQLQGYLSGQGITAGSAGSSYDTTQWGGTGGNINDQPNF
jgi:hypothetical protein